LTVVIAPKDQGLLTSEETPELKSTRQETVKLRREKDFSRPGAAHFAKEQRAKRFA